MLLFLNYLVLAICVLMFSVVLFAFLVTVPKKATSSLSHKFAVWFTRRLRAGGSGKFFYWFFPILVLLFGPLWGGVLLLIATCIGVTINRRLAIDPAPLVPETP